MAIKTVETALQFHLAAIRPELVAIQNGVLSNTPVRQELVKTVSMGPFKHHVDEGMETRKVTPISQHCSPVAYFASARILDARIAIRHRCRCCGPIAIY